MTMRPPRSAKHSPSPRRRRRGPGRGVAFLLDFPSPQPSPRSFLAGRGRPTLDVPMLNSMAVQPYPLPFPRGEGMHHRSVVYPAGSLAIMKKVLLFAFIPSLLLAAAIRAADRPDRKDLID